MPTIDFVHDFLCPWCRVGAHYLDQALASWGGPAPVVRVHPYQLSPETPEEGTDYQAHLATKFGADRVKAMHGRLEELGARIGLPFHFDRMEKMPNTARAHAMVAATPVNMQWRLVRAIEEAYFAQGQNIGDAEVLARIGEAAGLTPDEARTAAFDGDLAGARAEAQDALEGGITGVPTFVFDARRQLVGAQPAEVLLKALSRSGQA